MRLKNKIAIISGSGSGLGRATALLFAREGATIIGCGRTIESGEETSRMVKKLGAESLFVQADVSKSSDVQNVINVAVDQFGRVDIMVNNAGVGPSGPYNVGATVDIPEKDWDAIIAINLNSVYLFSKYVIPVMKQNGGGVIANVSSFTGLVGFPLNHNYGVAKAGVIALTRNLAVTYGRDRIRVNCLVAGVFESSLMGEQLAAHLNQVVSNEKTRYALNPLGRMSTPEELAPSLLFLCSDESSFMHGEAMVVDGGQSISPVPPGFDG